MTTKAELVKQQHASWNKYTITLPTAKIPPQDSCCTAKQESKSLDYLSPRPTLFLTTSSFTYWWHNSHSHLLKVYHTGIVASKHLKILRVGHQPRSQTRVTPSPTSLSLLIFKSNISKSSIKATHLQITHTPFLFDRCTYKHNSMTSQNSIPNIFLTFDAKWHPLALYIQTLKLQTSTFQ